MASPVLGPAGNVEFLLYGARAAPPPAPIDLDAVVAEAEGVRAP